MSWKFNLYFGAAAGAWLLTLLIITAELSESFKTLLKTMFVHHWIAKAVLITIAFVIFGFLLKEKNAIGRFSDEKIALYSVQGAFIIIFLFYVLEYFA